MNQSLKKCSLSIFRSINENEELFDFQTPITEDVFLLSDTSQIYRSRISGQTRYKRTKIVTKKQALNGQSPDFQFEPLFQFTSNKDLSSTSFELKELINHQQKIVQQFQSLDSRPFICLSNRGRSSQLPSYVIAKANILKLGATYYKIIQTHLAQNQRLQNIKMTQEEQNNIELNQLGNIQPFKRICRICLSQDDQDGDFIAPCDCKGSCKYVHFSCLKTWIQNKVKKQENRLVTSYFLAKLQCQLCKKALPNCITLKNSSKTLLQFEKPEGPYLILEKIEARKEQGKTFILLTPKEEGIKIGRGFGSDWKINDITISRIHCSILFKNNQFILQDQGSKFGTFVLLQKSIQAQKFMCLKIGAKVYKIEEFSNEKMRAISSAL